MVLMLIVYFKPGLDTGEITNAIERVRKTIKEEFTRIEFVIIQPQGYNALDNSQQKKQQ